MPGNVDHRALLWLRRSRTGRDVGDKARVLSRGRLRLGRPHRPGTEVETDLLILGHRSSASERKFPPARKMGGSCCVASQ